ncbi:MAG: HAMP domain-containing histidine kinase, partial [candidate division KSB1 bacterium]|nr:HAMP domain-containing histidine kinase [candidate division KSB1 bacterium]
QSVNISIIPWKKYLRIIIKDNGPGMDKETLDNIFIPFHTKKAGGTGLGVPIAKKIIDGHNGKISIESLKGKGTTVTIDLFQGASGEERTV